MEPRSQQDSFVFQSLDELGIESTTSGTLPSAPAPVNRSTSVEDMQIMNMSTFDGFSVTTSAMPLTVSDNSMVAFESLDDFSSETVSSPNSSNSDAPSPTLSPEHDGHPVSPVPSLPFSDAPPQPSGIAMQPLPLLSFLQAGLPRMNLVAQMPMQMPMTQQQLGHPMMETKQMFMATPMAISVPAQNHSMVTPQLTSFPQQLVPGLSQRSVVPTQLLPTITIPQPQSQPETRQEQQHQPAPKSRARRGTKRTRAQSNMEAEDDDDDEEEVIPKPKQRSARGRGAKETKETKSSEDMSTETEPVVKQEPGTEESKGMELDVSGIQVGLPRARREAIGGVKANGKTGKKERNKVSASKYRKRRKVYLDNLESQMQDLVDQVKDQNKRIATVANENNTLKGYIGKLKDLLQLHNIQIPAGSVMFAMFAFFVLFAAVLLNPLNDGTTWERGPVSRNLLGFENKLQGEEQSLPSGINSFHMGLDDFVQWMADDQDKPDERRAGKSHMGPFPQYKELPAVAYVKQTKNEALHKSMNAFVRRMSPTSEKEKARNEEKLRQQREQETEHEQETDPVVHFHRANETSSGKSSGDNAVLWSGRVHAHLETRDL